MPLTFRLQDLRTLDPHATTFDEHQAKEDAADVQAFKTVTVQVRKPVAGTGPTTGLLYLEHSATLDSESFVIYAGVSFNLKNTDTEVATLTSPLKYLRWYGMGDGAWTTNPQFMIDLVGRES